MQHSKHSASQDKGAKGESKEKKPRTAPTNTSLLPPCKVCWEPAAGFHYGANTCEACKGFFRRSLLRKEEYKCHGGGNCNIRAGKRKICPRCRYSRCLAVGMSLEAVKTGRYTHAKRTRDVLEYQQMMGLVSQDTRLYPSTPVPSATINSLSPVLLTANAAAQSTGRSYRRSFPGSASPPSVVASFPSSGEVDSLYDSAVELAAVEPAGVLGCMKHVTQSKLPLSPRNGESMSLYDRGCKDENTAPHDGSCHDKNTTSLTSSCKVENTSGDARLSTKVNAGHPSPAASLLTSPSASSGFSSSCQSLDFSSSSPGSSNVSSTSNVSPASNVWSPHKGCMEASCWAVFPAEFPMSPLPASLRGSAAEDAACEEVVTHLVESHDRLLHFPSDDLTPQQIVDKLKESYEACKVEQEVFGARELSEPEYQDIYQKTGLDVDNRQPFITTMVNELEDNIKRTISFIKTVPGFSQLPMKDKILLIKDNRCELRMITTSHLYHPEWKVMMLPSGSCHCIHQLQKLGKVRNATNSFDCSALVQKLGLTHEEKVMLKALVVTMIGKGDVEDWEAVSALNWKMAQSLLWLLKKNRGPEANRTFARIMLALCRLREMCVEFYRWIESNPLENYSQFRANRFMAEWFSTD